MSAISANISVMIKAAEKAARSLIRDFNEVEKLQISVKGPGDFVSRADKRAEEIIVESLSKDRPEWGFLGEEGTSKIGSDPRYRWIIDPLDGTNNFLHGVPHWAITVALEKDGEIVAGITYDPVRQEMFRAEKGSGAIMNNTRLRVSGRKDITQAILVTDNALKDKASLEAYEQKMTMVGTVPGLAIRTFGSAALDLAYVAAGRFDGFYLHGGTYTWDLATGILLIREAAGVATDLDLKPAVPEKGNVLAGNPVLHKAFAELIGLKQMR
jgi:myo-inositol-1(or 4)-monophosphatase